MRPFLSLSAGLLAISVIALPARAASVDPCVTAEISQAPCAWTTPPCPEPVLSDPCDL